MKTLAISSLSFIFPCILSLYYNKYIYSISMLMLVLTSIANHQYGYYKNIDRIYARIITLLYTYDAYKNNIYSAVLCGFSAAIIYKYRTRIIHHVFMHIIGSIGFTSYIYNIKFEY